MKTLLLCLFALAASAAEPEFPYEKAKASTMFVAFATRFDDGADGFTYCAGVLVDAKKKYLLTPIQCIEGGKQIACKSALEVRGDQQQSNSDFKKWLAAGSTCEVVRRFPSSDLALLKLSGALPAGAVAPSMKAEPLKVGERAWTVGFAEQVPALLAQGTVAAVLSKIHVDGLSPEFTSPLLGVSGASAESSAGSGLYDAAGALAGIVIADAKHFDGAFAVPAATIAKLDLK